MRQRRIRHAVMYWQHNVLHRALLAWRQHTALSMAAQLAQEQAVQHCATILQRKALLALADHLVWRQEKALLAYQAEGHMNGFRLAGLFAAWREVSGGGHPTCPANGTLCCCLAELDYSIVRGCPLILGGCGAYAGGSAARQAGEGPCAVPASNRLQRPVALLHSVALGCVSAGKWLPSRQCCS